MSIQEDLESCEYEQLFDNQPVKIVHNLTLFTIAVSVDQITSICTIISNRLHNSLLFQGSSSTDETDPIPTNQLECRRS